MYVRSARCFWSVFSIIIVVLVTMIGLAAVSTMAGCLDGLQVKKQLDTSEAALAEERLKLEIERERLVAAKATTDEVDKALVRIKSMEKDLTTAKEVWDRSFNADGSPKIENAAAAAGAVLPPPWGSVLVIGGAVVGMITQQLRLGKVKADGDALADSIEAMRASSAALKNEMARPEAKAAAARVLAQRPGARAIIERRKVT